MSAGRLTCSCPAPHCPPPVSPLRPRASPHRSWDEAQGPGPGTLRFLNSVIRPLLTSRSLSSVFLHPLVSPQLSLLGADLSFLLIASRVLVLPSIGRPFCPARPLFSGSQLSHHRPASGRFLLELPSSLLHNQSFLSCLSLLHLGSAVSWTWPTFCTCVELRIRHLSFPVSVSSTGVGLTPFYSHGTPTPRTGPGVAPPCGSSSTRPHLLKNLV